MSFETKVQSPKSRPEGATRIVSAALAASTEGVKPLKRFPSSCLLPTGLKPVANEVKPIECGMSGSE